MNRLLKFLKENVEGGGILLHGNFKDLFISDDLVFREFGVLLKDVLKEAGFKNVIFFDTTNALGKFVYDDESARYSIQGNEEGVSGFSATDEDVPVFGNFIMGDSPSFDSPSSLNGENLVYQQKDMNSSIFYDELVAFLKKDDPKTAVVFTDTMSFLQFDPNKNKYAQLINFHWRKKHLIIFLHSDLNNNHSNSFRRLLEDTSLLNYFYQPAEEGNYLVPQDKRVFSIRDIEEDEVINLLGYFHIIEEIPYEGNLKTCF